MKIPCSVPILTLNSEKLLPGCLKSLVEFQDVFLLDGNSTDSTLEIARKFGVRVEKQVDTDEKNVRIKDFTAMRLKAISLTKCDWILDLDSDEYVSEALTKEISEVLEKREKETNVAFSIENKLIIEGKIIEHAFHTTSSVRLYNKKSSIGFKKGKVVHEQYEIPSNVEVLFLKNYIYSFSPDTYLDCIEKDNKYLELMRNKLLHGDKRRQASVVAKSFFLNIARSIKILLTSIFIYLRYGFENSLPPAHVWRYVRYHLIMSSYRLRQLFS